MGDRVECRSDHDYIGHPLAFYWQDMRLEVAEVFVAKPHPSRLHFPGTQYRFWFI